MSHPFEAHLEIATAAAHLGGEILLAHQGKLNAIRSKGASGDLVTEADEASEKAIIQHLHTAFPQAGFLAEESGAQAAQNSDLLWIIDPLDGTLNFAHGLPFFSVTLALSVAQSLEVAVTYIPILNECFTAIKGQGAWLNETKIQVSATESLLQSLLVTGFPYRRAELKDNNYAEFCHFADRCQDIRRPGSAALDLAYVACGRFDGYWEGHLNPWDLAAGALLVQEAGGQVSAFGGSEFDLHSGQILATNGQIHHVMVQGLQTVRQPQLI